MTEPVMEQRDDYDSPWKDILQEYFREFLAFFFPQVESDVDWDKNYEFLDKEFQQVVRDAELGRRYTDKLVKVWQKSGGETWVLVHIEVQGCEETEFAERMYVYNYRIFDRYRRPVASLAVLADERPGWKPDQFGYKIWGCEAMLRFPVVKLLDYGRQWNRLEERGSPFAVVVMAHLKAMETRNSPEMRKKEKLNLIKMLYKRGYSRPDILRLFAFIDWVMNLPRELSESFWNELSSYEEEKKMGYVTSVERIGIEKGIQQGRREGVLEAIEFGLSLKFGAMGLRILQSVQDIDDLGRLEAIKEALKVSDDFEEIERLIHVTGKA